MFTTVCWLLQKFVCNRQLMRSQSIDCTFVHIGSPPTPVSMRTFSSYADNGDHRPHRQVDNGSGVNPFEPYKCSPQSMMQKGRFSLSWFWILHAFLRWLSQSSLIDWKICVCSPAKLFFFSFSSVLSCLSIVLWCWFNGYLCIVFAITA